MRTLLFGFFLSGSASVSVGVHVFVGRVFCVCLFECVSAVQQPSTLHGARPQGDNSELSDTHYINHTHTEPHMH